MARKILTGPATPVALGQVDANGDWQATVVGGSGVPAVDIGVLPVGTQSSGSGTAGFTLLVAAPGVGYRIIVPAFCMQNETGSATVMIIQSGTNVPPATVNGWRCLGQNQGDGLAMTFPTNAPWRLNENEGLYFWLNGSNNCNCSFSYYVAAI
jgi:hypothetical protein